MRSYVSAVIESACKYIGLLPLGSGGEIIWAGVDYAADIAITGRCRNTPPDQGRPRYVCGPPRHHQEMGLVLYRGHGWKDHLAEGRHQPGREIQHDAVVHRSR